MPESIRPLLQRGLLFVFACFNYLVIRKGGLSQPSDDNLSLMVVLLGWIQFDQLAQFFAARMYRMLRKQMTGVIFVASKRYTWALVGSEMHVASLLEPRRVLHCS